MSFGLGSSQLNGRNGAPATSSYVVIGADGALTSERQLTGTANQIIVTDNGAGSTVVLSTPQNIHTAATPTFAGITLSGLTAGRLPIVSTGGLVADDSELLWDATNNVQKIGSTGWGLSRDALSLQLSRTLTTPPDTAPGAVRPMLGIYGTFAQSGAINQGRIGLFATVGDDASVVNKTITGAVNNGSGLIRLTVTGHGFATSDRINVYQVGGVTAANGVWTITVIDANTFDLQGSTFSGTYTSGGVATNRGLYYAATLNVRPALDRDGGTLTGTGANGDDVAALTMSNDGAGKATDAIWITDASISGGSKAAWQSILATDSDVDKFITLTGKVYTHGINLSGATVATSSVPMIKLGAGHNVELDTATGTKWGTSSSQKQAWFGATPVVQNTSTTDLRTGLINLGFFASGGASPLNLNGGTLTAANVVSDLFSGITKGKVVFNPSGGSDGQLQFHPSSETRPLMQLEDAVASGGSSRTDTRLTIWGRSGTGAVANFFTGQINLGAIDGTSAAAAYGLIVDGQWTNGAGFTSSSTQFLLHDEINVQNILRHAQSDTQLVTIGDDVNSAPTKGMALKVTGRNITTQATGTVMGALIAGTLAKTTAGDQAFLGLQVKPTLNTTGSNSSSLTVFDVDTTNTSTTGLTTNLAKFSYGGTQRAVLTSAGYLGLGSITPTAQIHVISPGGSLVSGLDAGGVLTSWYFGSTNTDTTTSAHREFRVETHYNGASNPASTKNVFNGHFSARIDSANSQTLSNVQIQALIGNASNLGTGTVGAAWAAANTVSNSSTGTITDGTASRASVSNSNASGTITTAYYFRATDLTNSGTIGTLYGYYCGDITTGTQTNRPFSFYASDANADNYFSGNVYGPAGSTSMTKGFMYIPAAAGAPTAAPPETFSGRVPMYYDTTNNKLYVYNGAWKSTAALT